MVVAADDVRESANLQARLKRRKIRTAAMAASTIKPEVTAVGVGTASTGRSCGKFLCVNETGVATPVLGRIEKSCSPIGEICWPNEEGVLFVWP